MGMLTVNALVLYAGVQLVLTFGLAALLWPNKFMPLFEVLMFPWNATYGWIRTNGIAAIGFALLLLATRLIGNR